MNVNIIDWIFIAVLVIFALVGIIKGAILQLFNLVGLILAILVPVYFCDDVTALFSSGSNTANTIVSIITWLVMFGIILILFHYLGKTLRKAIHGKTGRRWLDRIFGALFASIKGFLIIAIPVFIIGIIPESVSPDIVSFRQQLAESKIAAFFLNHNLLDKLNVHGNIQRISESMDSESQLEDLIGEEKVEYLLHNEDFQQIMNDDVLIETLREGNYLAFIADSRVRRLMKDKDVRSIFLGIIFNGNSEEEIIEDENS
ncbi:MAG: CvpA family protein [Candidatus Theseobacter exili]|nr:CvpA family protein [Candidatus Theseobacter exili]